MKKYIAGFIVLLMLLMSIPIVGNAEVGTVGFYNNYVRVGGRVENASGEITLLIKDSVGTPSNKDNIKYMYQTTINEDGSYAFKIPVGSKEDVLSYNYIINLDGIVANDTIREISSIQEITSIVSDISETETQATLTATVNSGFDDLNDTYEMKLILAFYGDDNVLIDVALSEFDSIMVNSAENTATLTSDKPVGTKSAIGYVWESMETMKPLTDSKKLLNDIYSITCWGDSMTAGAGASNGSAGSYPVRLKALLDANCDNNYTVYNMGVGGEGAATIASRQGGNKMVISKDVVIGTECVAVPISITGKDGGMIAPLVQDNGAKGINLCEINGVKGNLRLVDGVYSFKRQNAGDEIKVSAGTEIVTSAMKERTDDIVIVFMGQNDPGMSADKLQSYIDGMLDYLTYSNKKYIIVGVSPHKDWNGNGYAEMEASMLTKYGENYINLRQYMISDQAFIDAGITKTADDIDCISKGVIPSSFRHDAIHYNDIGYKLLSDKVYEKLVELDYVK